MLAACVSFTIGPESHQEPIRLLFTTLWLPQHASKTDTKGHPIAIYMCFWPPEGELRSQKAVPLGIL